MVNNVPALQETRAQPLAWEDALEKDMATHCSVLAWRIPWTEESGRLQSTGYMTEATSQACMHMITTLLHVYKKNL